MIEGLHQIPRHMHEPMIRWINYGEPAPDAMGSFLRAVLTNDLQGAFDCADDENLAAIRGWITFLYNDAPGPCHGTKERLVEWHERGGLAGRAVSA